MRLGVQFNRTQGFLLHRPVVVRPHLDPTLRHQPIAAGVFVDGSCASRGERAAPREDGILLKSSSFGRRTQMISSQMRLMTWRTNAPP